MVTLPYHEDRMHDDSAPGWRQTIDQYHTKLVDDLTAQVNAEILSSVSLAVAEAVDDERKRADDERALAVADAVRSAIATASEEARRRLAESVNQTLRRIRRTTAEHETLQLLLEEISFCAERAVVLLIENNQARIALWRGVVLREEEEDAAPIELSDAAALSACVESRDPVVALASAGEVSARLASALSASGTERVYLFPVTARQTTVALILATGSVTAAPIELLCETTGMKLESLGPSEPEAASDEAASDGVPLVQITPAPNGTGWPVETPQLAETPATWSKLTPQEQAAHLKAQRTARVRVAQMRISESDALRKGAQAGDIYRALRSSIDAAREEFQQSYIAQSPTMVDYLHLELVRSLARDDSSLLGRDYPGPIV